MSWTQNLNAVTPLVRTILKPIVGFWRGGGLLLLVLCLALESWAQTGTSQASSSRDMEICLINPQKNKSLESLILEIEPRPQVQVELKRRAQILNSSRSLQVPVDSYTQILPWSKRPDKAWVTEHCYRVGYVSEEVLTQTPASIWSSLNAKNLKFTDIETFYSLKEKEIALMAPLSPSVVPPEVPIDTQARHTFNPPQTDPHDFKDSSTAKPNQALRYDSQQTPKIAKISNQEVNKYEWSLVLGIINGAEFSNAKGMGIVDEISLLTTGIEVGTSKYFTDWFSVYGLYRYILIVNAESKDLTQSDLVGEYDRQLTLGFNLHLSDHLSVGANLKESRWLLYQRTTPIFVLESFRQQVNIGALKFEWIFNESTLGKWGLVGIYGKGLDSTDEYKAKDYHTALVLKNQNDIWAYELSLAYELNSYKYGSGVTPPSSIAEINRNRYLFTIQVEF